MRSAGTGTSAVCAAALAFSACASGGDTEPAQPPGSSAQPSSSSAQDLTAYQMCQSAAGNNESVVAAHLTTVIQVRTRRGGPPPGHSPAEKPWAHLPDEAAAAWCTFQSGSRYVVAATTEGGRRAVFMISESMLDPGSQGPAIP